MREAPRDYEMCGWRVRSEILLPELPPWSGDGRAHDIDLKLRPLPAVAGTPVAVTPFLRVYADGACRLDVPAVASYLVRRGAEILIEAHTDGSAPDVRTFLLDTVLALLVHQRRLLPLHAAGLRIGGGAVALVGASRTGKSTLAAALARRGHGVLADNVCVVDPAAAQVHSSVPGLRLWQEALDALGLPSAKLAANRTGQAKYHVPFPNPAGAAPLRIIYLLNHLGPGEPEAITSVPPDEAAAVLAAHVCAPHFGECAGDEIRAGVDRIARAVPVRRLAWQMRFEALDGLAQALESDAAS